MRAVAHRGVPTPADECLLWGEKGRGADLSVCPLMTIADMQGFTSEAPLDK